MNFDRDSFEAFWQNLKEVLEYRNGQEITFEQETRERISVSAPWPDFEEHGESYQLDLFGSFSGPEELAKLLHISSRNDLDALTPAKLVESFHQGKIGLSCMVFNGLFTGDLTFHVSNAKLWATESNRRVTFQIGEIFKNPMEYVQFTNDYFLEHPGQENLGEDEVQN